MATKAELQEHLDESNSRLVSFREYTNDLVHQLKAKDNDLFNLKKASTKRIKDAEDIFLSMDAFIEQGCKISK
jgi:hypothetical protein